ncbi:hypothetical protein ABZ490_03990 [Streptomyces sp. NPDC005811]|uniref:hypothetical protein n=1 Tax=Streptomyces sp. NPDC005811 TaxID=3154565 RepID=UPI0033F9D424
MKGKRFLPRTVAPAGQAADEDGRRLNRTPPRRSTTTCRDTSPGAGTYAVRHARPGGLDGDGRAEVLVHTAAGADFADGATGAERTRQSVPDGFVADGPSGGQFGSAHLDGEHRSLVTMLVTRGDLTGACAPRPSRPARGSAPWPRTPRTASSGPSAVVSSSTYTDHHLGTETRRIPRPALTTTRGADRRDDHA